MNTDKIYAEKLAEEYAEKGTSKVVALKKLNRRATLPATIFGYAFGIICTQLFGLGMCLSSGAIGNGLAGSITLGIVLGIVGLVGVAVNYPIYSKLLKNCKKKYAADIIRLAEEVGKEA